jgi:membrane protein YqaA with SNARE-associated domain
MGNAAIEYAMLEYGGLFLSSFLAATVLPFSSEAVLAGLYVAKGGASAGALLATASVGNTLGSFVNFLLGRFCLRWRDARWFPVTSERLDRAGTWFRRFGAWSLLFAWVPLLGDPLTVAAGMLRVNLWLFLVLVAVGKTARYVAVLWAASAVV